MLFTSLLAASALLVGTQARHVKRADGITISSKRLEAKRDAMPIAVTDVVVPIKKKPATGASRARAAALVSRATGATIPNGPTTTLESLFTGEEFAASVTFGTTTLELIVDTGSSDTWAAETGFTCENANGRTVSQATCEFGPLYTKSSTFTAIASDTFSIEYGDGEFLSGVMGTEEVTVAGVKVDTEIALVTSAFWEGDGTTSGLMGLAYPELTSASKGVYNPIFTTMFNDGLVAMDAFSLLIERNNEGDSGFLALGGVPDVAFTQNFTSTPIITTHITGFPVALDFYTINIGSMTLNGATIANSGGTSIEYIVDSGTTLNYFPTSVANAINNAFSPAAKFSNADGAYVVSCTAKPPALSIVIGGVAFPINPLDMILDAGGGVCITGINDGGSSLTADVFILGDTFQKNVVSLFDIGAATMQFAGREFYASDDTV